MFAVGYSSWVRKGLLLVTRDRFIQILYNAVKILIFFKCDELSKSTAFTFSTLLIFLEYLFEFLINTASPASDSLSTEFYGKKALNIIISPPPSRPPFVVILFCLFFFNHIIFTYWLVSICLYCCPFTPSRGVAINVFHVVTIIRLTNKNDVIAQLYCIIYVYIYIYIYIYISFLSTILKGWHRL